MNCNALCDLGASISVMPKSFYEMLNLNPFEECYLNVHLADSSKKKPLGRVDDVLIVVNYKYVPVDFIVMDIVATVEHGVPLMRSKWVHRTWAHQEGTQGQGTRLADAPPPICLTAPRRMRHRQPRQETRGPSGAPSTRKQVWRSPGPSARQEARRIPGNPPPDP